MPTMAAGVRYIALLRGINVGGKNLVKMAELREAFEELGFADVSTYIASGNVLFRAPRQKRAELAADLEGKLSKRFGLELKVVLLTEAGLRSVIEGAPPKFGGGDHLCDVIFVRAPLTVKRLSAELETKDDVDRKWEGRGVVYFSRLDAKRTSSRLGKIAAKPEYKEITIRSWRTTTKLAELLASAGDDG